MHPLWNHVCLLGCPGLVIRRRGSVRIVCVVVFLQRRCLQCRLLGLLGRECLCETMRMISIFSKIINLLMIRKSFLRPCPTKIQPISIKCRSFLYAAYIVNEEHLYILTKKKYLQRNQGMGGSSRIQITR